MNLVIFSITFFEVIEKTGDPPPNADFEKKKSTGGGGPVFPKDEISGYSKQEVGARCEGGLTGIFGLRRTCLIKVKVKVKFINVHWLVRRVLFRGIIFFS